MLECRSPKTTKLYNKIAHKQNWISENRSTGNNWIPSQLFSRPMRCQFGLDLLYSSVCEIGNDFPVESIASKLVDYFQRNVTSDYRRGRIFQYQRSTLSSCVERSKRREKAEKRQYYWLEWSQPPHWISHTIYWIAYAENCLHWFIWSEIGDMPSINIVQVYVCHMCWRLKQNMRG